MTILGSIVVPHNVHAATYDVTAQVNAPMPPTVPVVVTPDDNSTQVVPNIFVTGQCTIVVPSLIVVLVRDNITIGSGPCLPNGTFSILVGLVLGTNVIYPKFVNITGQVSSFGAPLTLLYNPPQTTRPNNPNTTPTPQDAASLQVIFNYDFVTYDIDVPTQLQYSVAGGTKPYTVIINWADGTQITQKVTDSAPQTIKHQYRKILPPSSMTLSVLDSRGQKVVQSRALVSFRKGVYVPAASPISNNESSISTTTFIWIALALVAAMVLYGHYFGTQYLKIIKDHKLKKQKTKNRPKAKK